MKKLLFATMLSVVLALSSACASPAESQEPPSSQPQSSQPDEMETDQEEAESMVETDPDVEEQEDETGPGEHDTADFPGEMTPEAYVDYIFAQVAALSGDASFTPSSQNVALEVSSGSERDYVLTYDAGKFHLYTADNGMVQGFDGAVVTDDMVPYFAAAFLASLEPELPPQPALELVEELMQSGESILSADNVVLQLTENTRHFTIFGFDVNAYRGDSYYETRAGENNLDITMYMLSLG